MNCPRCGALLAVVERHGIELDCCLACRGLWFDAGELGLLAGQGGADPAAFSRLESGAWPSARPGSAHPRGCPRCDRTLQAALVRADPPLVIDRCPEGHGVWFDHGELEHALAQHSDDPQWLVFVATAVPAFASDKESR